MIKKRTKRIIAFLLISTIIGGAYFVGRVYVAFRKAFNTCEAYSIQRILLGDIVDNYADIDDGNIKVEKYIQRLEVWQQNIASKYDFTFIKHKEKLKIIVSTNTFGEKDILIRESFTIVPEKNKNKEKK